MFKGINKKGPYRSISDFHNHNVPDLFFNGLSNPTWQTTTTSQKETSSNCTLTPRLTMVGPWSDWPPGFDIVLHTLAHLMDQNSWGQAPIHHKHHSLSLLLWKSAVPTLQFIRCNKLSSNDEYIGSRHLDCIPGLRFPALVAANRSCTWAHGVYIQLQTSNLCRKQPHIICHQGPSWNIS